MWNLTFSLCSDKDTLVKDCKQQIMSQQYKIINLKTFKFLLRHSDDFVFLFNNYLTNVQNIC